MSSKSLYLLGGIIVLLIVITAALAVSGIPANLNNSSSGNSHQDQSESQLTISERAEEFRIGGSHNKGFEKVVFDPFLVKAGQKQELIVFLKPDLNYSEVKATFKDEKGKQQKTLEKSTLNGNTVYYSSWKPDKVNSEQYYPVTIGYTTDSGKTNKLSLSWQGK